MKTLTRAALDREIKSDGDLLRQVVMLLKQKIPLSEWPEENASVLFEAIGIPGSNLGEIQKAHRLRRHLFIDMAPPSFSIGRVIQKRVDRLRSDLADLINFGAGIYLIGMWTPPR